MKGGAETECRVPCLSQAPRQLSIRQQSGLAPSSDSTVSVHRFRCCLWLQEPRKSIDRAFSRGQQHPQLLKLTAGLPADSRDKLATPPFRFPSVFFCYVPICLSLSSFSSLNSSLFTLFNCNRSYDVSREHTVDSRPQIERVRLVGGSPNRRLPRSSPQPDWGPGLDALFWGI